jgi:serine protease
MVPSTRAAIAALDPRDGLPPARYALELRPGQSPDDVDASVREALAEFGPDVWPISPTDHGVLILRIGTRTLHGVAPARAFAAGYALADEFDLRTAEPDLPTPFFPEEDPPPEGVPVEEAFRFPPGCWVDAESGLPDRWALDRLRVPEAWAFSQVQGRPAQGLGVVIAQPDTGVIEHTELAGVTRIGGYDVLGHDPDPTDPLEARALATAPAPRASSSHPRAFGSAAQPLPRATCRSGPSPASFLSRRWLWPRRSVTRSTTARTSSR